MTNKEIPEQNISDIVNSISGLEELKTFLLAIKKRSGSFFPNVLGGEKFLTIITERIKQLSLEAISTLISVEDLKGTKVYKSFFSDFCVGYGYDRDTGRTFETFNLRKIIGQKNFTELYVEIHNKWRELLLPLAEEAKSVDEFKKVLARCEPSQRTDLYPALVTIRKKWSDLIDEKIQTAKSLEDFKDILKDAPNVETNGYQYWGWTSGHHATKEQHKIFKSWQEIFKIKFGESKTTTERLAVLKFVPPGHYRDFGDSSYGLVYAENGRLRLSALDEALEKAGSDEERQQIKDLIGDQYK